MKAIGYIRVSTEEQVSEGVSLEAQRAKVAAWADLNGYELGAIFADAGISGTKSDRPGLAAALDALGKGDALVVYSLSRLARSTRHTLDISERLDRAGADLVSLSERIDTTSAAGRMIFRMLAVLAEFERDQISERTSAAMQFKRSKGQRVGSIPYGYRLADDGSTLLAHAPEQAVITQARALRDAGLSLRKIAAELARMGFRARNGATFAAAQVQRMLLAA
ncbi:recombinase family protein [Candidatus Falkowbacteria bacterium]|nr:recombinase family protein [Candidatus Falkowbacteria bacterium]